MTGADRPLISVIVPSWNQAPYLRRCLDSILEQDYRPLEIVVVDGASDDGTVDVLHEYDDVPEVNWVSEPDTGIADAVNKGIWRANGSIAGIQSSDDFYYPGALSAAVQPFLDDPTTGLVYGDVNTVNVDEKVMGSWVRPPHDNARCIGLCVCIPQSSAFFSVALAREIGGWREQYHTADWDFWIRLMLRAPAVKVDGIWSAWRVYEGQRTDQRRKVFESFRRMIDESEDLKNAPADVRRAARAAKQLIGVSFDRRNTLVRLRYLAAATALYPSLWPDIPRKGRIIPGYRRLVRLRNGRP